MTPNSLAVWNGVDAQEAEGRLRSLRRREADLEEALSSQQQMQRIYPDGFAVSLARRSLEARQELLSTELASLLRYRANEPIKVSLDGREYHDHSASIATLGIFLLRLQKLYSAIAQAVQTGPTLRGPIASAIREATELRLAHVYESPFGMDLYVPSKLDLMGRSIASDSLSKLFELLSASRDEKQLMAISGSLGGRTTNHLRHLASYLVSSESAMSLSWLDYTGEEHTWAATRDAAHSIVANLKDIIQTKSVVKVFSGTLVGGSLFKNSFELFIRESGTLIEGGMVAAVAPAMKKYFGTTVSVTVDETEVLDRGSGDSRTYYVLTSINGNTNDSRPIPSGN
jgi:hypothetical protein